MILIEIAESLRRGKRTERSENGIALTLDACKRDRDSAPRTPLQETEVAPGAKRHISLCLKFRLTQNNSSSCATPVCYRHLPRQFGNFKNPSFLLSSPPQRFVRIRGSSRATSNPVTAIAAPSRGGCEMWVWQCSVREAVSVHANRIPQE
jgi:hypothetical protein